MSQVRVPEVVRAAGLTNAEADKGAGDGFAAAPQTLILTRPDSFPSEERFVTLGRDLLDRVLVVVWTTSEHAYRLISARRATTRERRQYAEDADA